MDRQRGCAAHNTKGEGQAIDVWTKKTRPTPISCNWESQFAVNGQNKIGIYIIPWTLIQLTVHEKNIVCNNQMLK